MTKVSVVIPVFNRQEKTARAVASVLAQDVAELEVVVVDDGSETPFTLAEVDDRVRIIRHPENRGAAAARNTAIREAAGEWLAFLDSDDVWLPGKLARQLDFAEADAAGNGARPPACYATGFVLGNPATGKRRRLIPIESGSASDFAAACWFCPGSTMLMHRDTARAIGPIDTTLPRLEDLDWFLRFGLIGGRLKVAPFIGADIEVGHKPDPAKLDIAAAALRRKWLAPGRGERLPAGAGRKLAAYLQLEQASARLAAGHYAGFAWHLARSILLAPRARLHLRPWWRESRPGLSLDPSIRRDRFRR
ncbi:hypothetical protein MesoLjLc_04680 [Mesorhizobium sp. L-8-10]|uniref:glycosyltransferase family 2 protein n=1 Tax=Mesorhizobium sp. L-8-10 TaxID=2744523 RepID=UPI0019263203|nr:glycosyltransferase family 2 protein [Mesorhizobium sp. L-8-10]BCH28538.1 hypothetical protein MesoLjLc_04680 [Mesorhizobium sp. L-8-10]